MKTGSERYIQPFDVVRAFGLILSNLAGVFLPCRDQITLVGCFCLHFNEDPMQPARNIYR
jgi:hypothetical protein